MGNCANIAERTRSQPVVLLVDDDADFLTGMREQLEGQVGEVLSAQSPLEALWLLEEKLVDVVVCDLVLGESDGLHLLEQVRVQWPSVARVLLTGFGERLVGQDAFPAAQAVIYKPTDGASLAALLQSLPRRRTQDPSGDAERSPITASPGTKTLRCITLERSSVMVRVALVGDLDEEAELSALEGSEETLVLDLSGVARINSTGVHKLILFLEGLSDERRVVCERCSPAFVAQLNLVPMIGRRVLVRSVVAPLECTDCLARNDIVVDVEPGREPVLPAITCQCGAPMELAELSQRYFAFLEP